jgi:YD repeat-containing protein
MTLGSAVWYNDGVYKVHGSITVKPPGGLLGDGWDIEGVDRLAPGSAAMYAGTAHATAAEALRGVTLMTGGGDTVWFPKAATAGSYLIPDDRPEFADVSRVQDGSVYRYTVHTIFGETQVYEAASLSTDAMIVSRTDRNGNRTTYEYYPGTTRLKSITDPFGRKTTYGYDVADKLSTITDFAGNVNNIVRTTVSGHPVIEVHGGSPNPHAATPPAGRSAISLRSCRVSPA